MGGYVATRPTDAIRREGGCCELVKKKIEDVPEGFQVIYRPWITLRNGKRLYASACGLTAFRLVVRS